MFYVYEVCCKCDIIEPMGCGGIAYCYHEDMFDETSTLYKAWKEPDKKFGNCETSVMITFHPAYLLRQADQKKYSWADLKKIKKKINELKLKI